MKERNSTIELLRFLLMLSICFLHILVHGKSLMQMGHNPEVVGSVWQLVALAFFFPAVCCFMFISGFYGIKLKKEKVVSLFVQAFLIFHIGKVGGSIMGRGGEIVPLTHLAHLEPITTHVWWFLSEYVCIMFLSPFIEEGIKSLTRVKFKAALIGLFMFNCIGLYITRFHTGSSLLGMLFIYLVARYIKLYVNQPSLRYSVLIWLLPVIIVSILMILSFNMGVSKLSWIMLWYCNPLIITSGIGLFFIFNNLLIFHSWIINWLGHHCLSIYLITEINKPIYSYWASKIENNFLYGLLNVLLCVVLFMVLDSFLSYINNTISNPILKMIDKIKI